MIDGGHQIEGSEPIGAHIASERAWREVVSLAAMSLGSRGLGSLAPKPRQHYLEVSAGIGAC